MTVYALELRSTALWTDVRYREYTSSAKKADLFKKVPRIPFTDSAHGIIPVVREHHGARLPRNTLLSDHVRESMAAMKPAPKPTRNACPNCGARLQWKANVDSDQRINFKWRYCEAISCGWDERKDGGVNGRL